MRISKTLFLASMAGVVALSASACGSTTSSSSAADAVETVTLKADYPDYSSAEGLVDAADSIVKGTVVDSRVEELYPDRSDSTDPRINPQAGLSEAEIQDVPPLIITVFTVAVDEAIKGDVKAGEKIEVSQLGGLSNGVDYVLAGAPLKEDPTTPVVLALNEHGDAPADLLNPELAAYKVESGGAIKPTSSENDLGVTSIGQLEALSQ